MNNLTRRLSRIVVLALIGASFAACHFHGGHGYGCRPHFHVPVRHCR